MARKKKSTAIAKKGITAIANWDAELSKHAQSQAEQEKDIGGGNFFSLRLGQLSLNGNQIPKNQMAVIIVAAIHENVYYEGDFDPEVQKSPSCFAFGYDDKLMKPHDNVNRPQCDLCCECRLNEWGSGENRKGKACKNRRRLGLISAGDFKDGKLIEFKESTIYDKEPVAFLPLPPTSLSNYANYVKQIANALKRPTWAVFTKVSLIPDPKTQFKVTFEYLGPVGNHLLGTMKNRYDEISTVIDFPYASVESEKPKKKTRKKRKY